MMETTHALVAGTIARHIPEPVTAATLSFLSHFLLDAVPHWDFGTNWRGRRKLYTGLFAICDVLLAYGLSFLLFRGTVNLFLLFLCTTVAMLPDWMEAPWYIFFASHTKKEPARNAGFLETLTFGIYQLENQFHHKTGFPLGVITQIVAIAFFFILLK